MSVAKVEKYESGDLSLKSMVQKFSMALAFVLSSFMVHGQINVLDTTNQWISMEYMDLYSGQTLSDTFHIKINNALLILKNGEGEKKFQIENIQGSWTDVSETGQLSFDIPFRDFKGKGLVKNESGTISLTIDFSERKDGMKRKFIIHQ